MASNVLGAVVSRELKVRAVVKQYYEVQVYDEFVIRGNTAVLKCHIPSFVHDYVAVTSWVRENSGAKQTIIENGGRYSILSNGVLHIRDVSLMDGHTSYRCQTKHLLTSETKTSTSAGRLMITDPKSSVPPRITHSRTHVEGQRGQRVELPCAAQGFPQPSYSWQRMKDSTLLPLHSSERMRQMSGTLVIHDLVQEDSATYVCFVNNSVGFERVETSLTVIATLSASIQPSQQVVDEGKPASFACSVSGFPVAFISWIKDGRHLVMDERVRLVSREVLHIEAVQREDRGMYQCLARNDHSSTQAAAELKIGDAPPVFSQTFPEQTLQPGRQVSLRCAASGSPTPQITWYLDDASLPVLDRFQLTEHVSLRGDVVSVVNVTKVATEDGGEYRCAARSRTGRVEHSARLNIFGPPIVRPMPNVSAIAGSDMVLRCRVAGHPIDVIRWERDGSVLPINHRQKVFPNGTLFVQDVQRPLDAGTYTCVVANKQEATARRNLHVAVLNSPVINPFSFPSNLREGLRAGIQCLVIEGDQPMSITWLKDDHPLASHLGVMTRTIDELTSSLVINNITPRHTGNYTCVARNAVATVRYSAALQVNVPPRWVVEPKDTAVILHESLRLDCQVDGSPTPSINWKKAMGKLPGDYKLVRQLGLDTVIAENGSLLVTSVRENHEGYYVCQATNGVGAELSKVVHVDVHVPARFETTFRNQTATKGGTVALVCDIRGDLPINVIWKIKGNKIDPSADNRFSVQEKATTGGMISELLVSKVDRRDNVQYGCHATNAFGRDESKIQVYVKEPPEPPKRLKVLETASRSVKLTWTSSYDGNSPILRFIIQFKTTSETWHPRGLNVTVPGSDSRAEVDGLHPALIYQFRVLAENSVGVSEPSSFITVTTLEEAPSGPTQEVRVDSTSSSSLRIRWKPPKRENWNGELKGYHIGYRDYARGSLFLFKSVDHRSDEVLEYILTDLDKFTQYGVTVEAFNRIGNGPRSSEVIAFTLEDVPSEPPQNVQCSTLSSRSIHVKWTAPMTSAIHGVLQGYRVAFTPAEQLSGELKPISTSALKADLHGLRKYTNYSIQVAAYNRAGDGKFSMPIFCSTDEDVPGAPAEVKALVMSSDAIIVSWRPPTFANGILTKYNIYIRELGSTDPRPIMYSLPPGQTHYEARGLKEDYHYEFWVTASTAKGEGEQTRIVSQTPISTVPARIASFPEQYYVERKDDVRLPCRSVGIPTPDREWRVRGQKIQEGGRILVISDGTLMISNVRHSDSGNYTCRVYNIYATDEVSQELMIKGPVVKEAPPAAPKVSIVFRTATSVSLKWKVEDDGGDVVQEFTLYYKQEGQEWTAVPLTPDQDSFTITSLHCGSPYHLYMTAKNRLGDSEPSEVTVTKTKGMAPVIPERDRFLRVNSTLVVLEFATWLDGGCPILYFVVEYKQKDESDWFVVSNDLEPKKDRLVIEGLTPGTWYNLRVTAFNDAGASTVEYDFPTNAEVYGKTLAESGLESNSRVSYFLDLNVIIPLITIASLILLGMGVVCLVFQCRRKRDFKQAKARVNARIPTGTSDFGKRLAGGGSPAFTQLPTSSSGRKLSAPGNSPFIHPHYDDAEVRDDVCPYATSQLSTCLAEDPASLQLKTFSHGGHKIDHMTNQRSEPTYASNAKIPIYAKPVKLITSSEGNYKFQKPSSPTHDLDDKLSPGDQNVPAQTCIPSPSGSQETLVMEPPASTNSVQPSAPPAEYESCLSDSDNPDLGLPRPYHGRSRDQAKRSSHGSGGRNKPMHRVPDLLYRGGDSTPSSSNEDSPQSERKEFSRGERGKSGPGSRRHSRTFRTSKDRSSSPESGPEDTPPFTIRELLGAPTSRYSDHYEPHETINTDRNDRKSSLSSAPDSNRSTSLTLAAEEEELIALLRRGPSSGTNKKPEREEIITRT